MGLILSIISAILWAFFDVVRKKAVQENSEKSVIFIIIASQIIFYSFLLFLSDLYIDINKYYLSGSALIVLNLISILLFLKVLKSGEISKYIPMLSFTPLFSALYSNLILDEQLIFSQYLGMLLIVLGSLLLHINRKINRTIVSKMHLTLMNKNLIMILLVSLIWSLTPVLDKECMKYTDLYLHGLLQAIGMLVVIPVLLIKKNTNIKLVNIKLNIKNISLSLIILSFLTSFMQLLALQYIFVAELESLKRSVGIILALLFGYYFFKETINLKKIFSVLIIVLGIINIINFT